LYTKKNESFSHFRAFCLSSGKVPGYELEKLFVELWHPVVRCKKIEEEEKEEEQVCGTWVDKGRGEDWSLQGK